MTRSYKRIEKYEEVKPSIKYNIIYRHKDKYAISVMCKFFNISRSGYYGYISRMNTPNKKAGKYAIINDTKRRSKNVNKEKTNTPTNSNKPSSIYIISVKPIPKSNTNMASLTVLSSIGLNNSLRIIP